MRVRLLFLFLLLPFLFVLSRSRRPLVFVFAIHHILERDEGRRCQHLARQAIETMYLPSLSLIQNTSRRVHNVSRKQDSHSWSISLPVAILRSTDVRWDRRTDSVRLRR